MAKVTSTFSGIGAAGAALGKKISSVFTGKNISGVADGTNYASTFGPFDVTSTFTESGSDFNTTLLLYGILTEDGINYIGSEYSRYIIQE